MIRKSYAIIGNGVIMGGLNFNSQRHSALLELKSCRPIFRHVARISVTKLWRQCQLPGHQMVALSLRRQHVHSLHGVFMGAICKLLEPFSTTTGD